MTSQSTLARPGPSPTGPTRSTPRRRRWTLILVAVVIVVLLAVSGWLVAVSPVLAARHVDVGGASVLSAAQVREAAQVKLGVPLARQDLQGIADRVAGLGPVAAVQVTRSWPRTVTISVQERTPLLAIHQPDGLLLVDRTGRGYLTVATLPAGVLLARANPSDEPLLIRLGTVAAALPPGLRSRVRLLQAHTADDVRLTLRNGDTVVWGGAEESGVKAQVLQALLKGPGRIYDVSAPQSPAVR